ncbi:coatomer subunit beta-1 [Tanacetum coccineum]
MARVHGVHDEKRVWFEVELQGAQGDREAEFFQVSNIDTAVAQRRLEDKQPEKKTNTDCLVYTTMYEEWVAKHLGVAGLQQHNGLVKEMNVTLLANVRCFLIQSGLSKVLWAKDTTMSTYLVNKDHTFEVEPQENVDQGAGLQEVQTQDLMDYQLARDREQHLACELFGYREEKQTREKGNYIKIIISLSNVPSALIYECAGTLMLLSSAPTAISVAANTYRQLLLSQSDNNVKLIILDNLNELKISHNEIMKILDIILDLITPRNNNEVVLTLKKEVVNTQSGELEKDGEYRQMLIQEIYSCAIKFPEVASTVVHLLMDFLGDSNVASAMDVAVFASEEGDGNDSSKKSQQSNSITAFADGTYVTQSAASENVFSPPTVVNTNLTSGNLKSLLLTSDFFLVAVVACMLTKLVLRLAEVQPSKSEINKAPTQVLLTIVSMLQLGQSSFLPHAIDNDSNERIVLCIRLNCNPSEEVKKIWLQSCCESFVEMLADKQLRETEELKAKAQVSYAQPDDLIDFYHLKSRKGMSQLELEDQVQDDLKRATWEFVKEGDAANKLNRILQLTGFSDPVYAESYVTVNHYDIVLDVTNYTLALESSKQIKANIKVSSTETGVIFENIVYETSIVMELIVIVLNDIHIDIMDYIILVIMPVHARVPKVSWKDIGGQREVKMQLMEAVEWPQKHQDAFRCIGTQPPSGVLLFGPPGDSRTLLARVVASEAKLNFLAENFLANGLVNKKRL